MKRFMFLLTLFLLLLGSAACAATMHWVEESRISLDIPAGIDSSVTKETGQVAVRIHSDTTDWAASIDHEKRALIRVSVTAPSGFTKYVSVSGNSFQNDEEAIAYLDSEAAFSVQTDATASNRYDVANFYLPSSVMIPNLSHANGNFYIRWYSEDELTTYAEKFIYNFTHDIEFSHRVTLQYLLKESLVNNAVLPTGITLATENGKVEYRIGVDAAENPTSTLVLNIIAPPGAIKGTLCRINPTSVDAPVIGGSVNFDIEYKPFSQYQEELAWVEWYDGSNNLISTQVFELFILNEQLKYYFEYPTDWYPIPSARVIIVNTALPLGVSATYDPTTGKFHRGYLGGTILLNDAWDYYTQVSISPPEGAAYAKVNRMSRAPDHSYQSEEDIANMESFVLLQDNRYPVDGAIEIFWSPAFQTLALDDGVLYMSGYPSPSVYDTAVNVLFWYDGNDQLLRKEYLYESVDTFSEIVLNPVP